MNMFSEENFLLLAHFKTITIKIGKDQIIR